MNLQITRFTKFGFQLMTV